MARVAWRAMSTTITGTPPALTQRQLQVVGLIALGCSNDEVGRRLGISPRTLAAKMKEYKIEKNGEG